MNNIAINQACDIAIFSFPDSILTDVVTYSIITASNGVLFASGNASFLADENWKVAFTPNTADIYIVKVIDSTTGVTKKELFNATYEVSAEGEVTEGSVLGQLSIYSLFNRALKKLRMPQLTNATQLLTLNEEYQFIWDTFQEELEELSTREKWTCLRVPGAFTLEVDTNQYLIADDMNEEDPESLVINGIHRIKYKSADELNRLYADRSRPGMPEFYCREGAYFKLNCTPCGSIIGLDVTYAYFKLAATISTSYPNNKIWIPSPFDLTYLVNKVAEVVYADRKNDKYLYFQGKSSEAYVAMWKAWKYHYNRRSIVDPVRRY